MKNEMTFDEWLAYGQEMGWATPVFCYTHDVPPTTEAEDAEIDDGCEVCMFCTRLMELS
jgi:hypothetical protein